ncbi:MAG: hypothetical protein FJ388_23730, partial [Verrucomicrobia bacterium]|nr:hypothetical protein [Verrucomicrobiota bacterium]
MKRALFFIWLVLPMLGQNYYLRHYAALRESALVGAAEVITVQQPATGARTIYFREGYVYCSVTCSFQLERDGAAATATALTVTKLHASNESTAATAFRSSDVGAGTAVSPVYSLAAGDYLTVDLSKFVLIG